MKNKLIISLLSLMTLVSAGCGKSDFLDINTDPNNPADVPPSVLLPSTTYSLAFTNGNELARVASQLIQHNAGIGNQALNFDIYILDGNFDNSWNFEIFVGGLPPMNQLIAKTQTLGPNYAGIAKVQKAYLFSIATDLWGDIPYSQAGDIHKYPIPRFDKQEDIYLGNNALGIQSLFDLIKEGIADMEKETPDGGFSLDDFGEDQVYGGDMELWIKMANTLRLKLAITISNVNPARATQEINDVLADGRFIEDNGEDYDVPFGTAQGSQSPFYSFNVTNRPNDMMMSSRLLAVANGLDTDVQDYLRKLYSTPTGAFVTYENGNNITAPRADRRSIYSDFVLGTSTTYSRMINNSNRAYILAEAALVLGTPGDANDLFQEGIRVSMLKSGMTEAAVNTFFSTHPALVTLTGTTEQKRNQIITWKYLANVVNPLEAYNDYRRTGYPALQVALNASGDDPTVIPKRFTYPPNETSANPNVPKPRPLTNQKVWWGK